MAARTYAYEHDEIITEALDEILDDVFSPEEVPDHLTYRVWEQPALDAELLHIGTRWETGGQRISLSFVLDTGRGGLPRAVATSEGYHLEFPEPSTSDIAIERCCLDREGNVHRSYAWNEESRSWELILSVDESSPST